MLKTYARYSPQFLAKKLGKFPPTQEQQKVIEAPLEPLLVVAGAGSGKTSTITDRIVWMVANGFIAPGNVLGVTFTRKAAAELATRVRRQLALLERAGVEPIAAGRNAEPDKYDVSGEDSGEPNIGTYHSYAQSIVSDYGVYLGIEPDSLLMSPALGWQLASSIVEDYEGAYDHFTVGADTLTRGIITLAAECSEHLVAVDEVHQYVMELLTRLDSLPQDRGKAKSRTQSAMKIIDGLRTRITLAELVSQYQRVKSERSLLDFGDLIVYAARIASEVPHAVRCERNKYQMVILDEFQDTSVAQLELFSALFGGGHAVTAVGDPQQSIYGFRGASAAGLYRFINKFPRKEGARFVPADVRYLLTSWRNSRAVLDVANRLAAPLAVPEYPVQMLVSAPDAVIGKVSINYYAQNSLSTFVSSEAEAIASAIKKLQDSGLEIVKDFGATEVKKEPSIAVLCRRRSQFQPLQRAFEAYGVSYEVVGLGGLLSTPEIVDLVSMLRVVADPLRSDSMMRLIGGARFRLGASDLMALWEWARGMTYEPSRDLGELITENFDRVSLVDILDNLPDPQWVSASGRVLSNEAHRRLNRLNQDIEYLRAIDTQDLMLLIDEAEKTMLLDVEMDSKPHLDIHRARANLDAFKQAAFTFTQQGGVFDSLATHGGNDGSVTGAWRRPASASSGDLGIFLSWLDVVTEREDGLEMPPQPARAGVAQILTVHASKGLEWDAVFVPGLAKGIFPSERSVSWTGADPGSLPWALRGDYEVMRSWDWNTEQEDLKSVDAAYSEHRRNGKEYAEKEERRLAYVAATRAKSCLWLSAAAWQENNSTVRTPSSYLMESARSAYNYDDYAKIIAAERPRGSGITGPGKRMGEGGGVEIEYWESSVPEENPRAADPTPPVLWPVDPLGSRRATVERAAAAVEGYLRQDIGVLSSFLRDNEWELKGVISYEQLDLLLKRAVQRDFAETYVPQHISASAVMGLEEDSEALIGSWRRPMPRPPSKAMRCGTLFHRWVEDYLTQDIPLEIDVPEYAAAIDAALDDIFDITAMKENFLRSPWAHRRAYAVEEPIETILASVVIRGKIDAVYRNGHSDGTYRWEIVDWKTGAVPDESKELATKAVQLALYRLAYSRIHAIDPKHISAAFFYVKENKIIRPELIGETELTELVRKAFERKDRRH